MKYKRVNKEALRAALARLDGNVTEAADSLSMSRMQISRLLKKYDLSDFARSLRLQSGAAATGRPRLRA